MYRLLSLFIVIAAAAVATEPGCTTVSCGIGTIEKNGECAPAEETHDPTLCGSGTTLIGDRCVTTVQCGDNTKMVIGSDGSVTCEGTGTVLDCTQALACPTPAAGKMTICGQLYDVKDMKPYQGSDAKGTPCATVTTEGPCALRMDAYDAIDFASHPGSAAPLQVGSTYIDDCGRFQFKDVPPPASPFVGLGFDDKDGAKAGPAGATNAVGVATAFAADSTTNLEAFVASKATTDMWTATGGPAVSTGIYVPIFRAHVCDMPLTGACANEFEPQSGVQIYKNAQAVPNNDYYFSDPSATAHTTIDVNQTATGSNGTGLLTGASVADSLAWTGMGGITDTTNCTWEKHAAASLPNIVTFQIYRPTNQLGKQCNQ
jgi:hypothetical protein